MWFYRVVALLIFAALMWGITRYAHWIVDGRQWGLIALTVLAMIAYGVWYDYRAGRLK
jgi:hypothetical protein